MSSVSQLTVITEHPIPIDRGRANILQDSNPMFKEQNRHLHPDELHEQYKDVFAENAEWRVFRSEIYGHSGYVYMWNYQLGYGVRIYDEDGSFQNFANALMSATENSHDV
jgi:hypothetical protein